MHINVQSIPGPKTEQMFIPSVAAAPATLSQHLFVAPYPIRVKAVEIVSQAAVVGDTTDHRNFNVINKGSDGTGVAVIASLDLDTGTDLAAFDKKIISTTLDVVMAEGDVLAMESEKVGAGVLIPDIMGFVTYESDRAPA